MEDYTVELVLQNETGWHSLSHRQHFEVKPVPNAPAEVDFETACTFQSETSELMRQVAGACEEIGHTRSKLRHMQATLLETPEAEESLVAQLATFSTGLTGIEIR